MEMFIARNGIVQQVIQAINTPGIQWISLDGPRGAGKTTILTMLEKNKDVAEQPYIFHFDEQIVTKQFHDEIEFMNFFSLKFGIDFFAPSILLLNEIQYSKNIETILHNLITQHKVQTKFITTGVNIMDEGKKGQDSVPTKRHSYIKSVTVLPLSFFEFLDYKGIDTQYLSYNTFSNLLFTQIQELYSEYQTFGGYPSVVVARSAEEKLAELKKIVQKVFDKDVGFWFSREFVFYFEKFIKTIADANGQSIKMGTYASTLGISPSAVKKFFSFIEENFLVKLIDPFFENKKREISHQKKIVFLDNGIINFLQGTLHSNQKISVNNLQSFFVQEILKAKNYDITIYTYKKINGSEIDLIIEYNNRLIPVNYNTHDSLAIPRVFHTFHETYQDRIAGYISLTHSKKGEFTIQNTTGYVLPAILIGEFWDTIDFS